MSPLLRTSLVLLLALQLGASESNCRLIDDQEDDDDGPGPDVPVVLLDESFASFALWTLSAPAAPLLDLAAGNPIPSMAGGSSSLVGTGAVTTQQYAVADGLTIEGDVNVPAGSQAWIGLSSLDVLVSPVGPSLAAGQWIDAGGTRHCVVNGADVATFAAPAAGTWHRLSTRIRTDGGIEFRIDGSLEATGSGLSPAHAVRPVHAGGEGYPSRPRIDNVRVRRP